MAARQAFSHEALSESTTTANDYPLATTFTFTPDANSDYFVFFSCLFANSGTAADHYGEVSLYHDQGGVSVGYFSTRSQELTAPRDYFSVFCVHKSSFGASPGAQDYYVYFNSNTAGETTRIKDIRLLAIKADAADQYAAVDASSSGTAGAGYATKTTLTFTPASTGDYLLISSAVLTSQGASTTGARLNHSGGSIYGERLTYPKNAWTYNAWATAAKINLAASSQTFTLQFSPSATVDADIEQARVLALRLDKFDNAYVAQDFTGGSTTAATDQDFLTLTQTPLALDHAVLAVAAFRTQSTTVSGYLNVAKDGANYTETVREGVNGAGWVHAGVAVKETLAASSTTWKWRARAETAGTTIHADDLLIAVLQLEAGGSTVTATASLDAAIQAARASVVSADAAVMKTIPAQATADAAVAKAFSGQATAEAAVRKAIAALVSADGAVQAPAQLAASFDAAVAALRSVQAQIDVAVRKAIAAGLGADAAVQQAFVASATLDAALQALRATATSLDAAVRTSVAATLAADAYITAASARQVLATVDAAVRATVAASLSLDAAVRVTGTAGASADAAVLAGMVAAVDAGAAVLATLVDGFTATAAVLAAQTRATDADAAVQVLALAGVSASAAVLRQWSGSFTADAALSLLSTDTVAADAAVRQSIAATITCDAIVTGGGGGAAIDLFGAHLPARSLAGARVLINRLGGLRIAVTQLLGGSEQ